MEDNKITNGQQKPDQTNSLAIAGLVLGLVSWFLNFFGIVGILAIVFSAIALSQIKRERVLREKALPLLA